MTRSGLLDESIALLRKELLLEWRQSTTLGGLLLYLASTVFVSYLSFRGLMDEQAWMGIFWIILLFASVNAAAKSFMHEPVGRGLYYYLIASAPAVILSKMIYNSGLLLLIGILHLGIYSMLVGNPVINHSLFLIVLFLGTLGLAGSLTLVSAIASKTGNNTTLLAILGFPLLLPLILLCIRLTSSAILGVEIDLAWKNLLTLGLLDVVIMALGLILFPYLWRD